MKQLHTEPSTLQILVVNSGSSSIKFSLVDPDASQHLLSAMVDRLGSEQAVLEWDEEGVPQQKALGLADHKQGMAAFFEWLRERMGSDWAPTAIGHRVVHGGEYFKHSCVINYKSLALLRACEPMAPLHNPVNILGIEAAQTLVDNPTDVMDREEIGIMLLGVGECLQCLFVVLGPHQHKA